MIKSRQEIKADAKAAMKEQRGTSILTPVILYVIVLGGAIFQFIPFIGGLLVSLTSFFIDSPLAVGVGGVFIKIYRREYTTASEIFSAFKVNYLRKVGGMAWMYLFTFLWTLLFIIPGIIKMLSYSMTPFILADCPNVTAKEALKLSMRMTKGYKLQLFVMFLSFTGWYILGLLTLGILHIVFVNPYLYTTYAGYYVEIKEQAIADGTISAEEFA